MASDQRKYDPSSIEPAWAERWVADQTFRAKGDGSKPFFYALDMFPYPSGDLHMGHLEAFSGGDVIARYQWMRGNDVLHPIGWDAFGLPAENAAIKRGNIHPKEWTHANIAQQEASFKRLGISFDWSRKLNTCDPEYYRWTQWLFLRLFERGLAYRKAAPANWCPNDQTVLANEQVVNGRCERCGAEVEKRDLVQWFFKITDYAQRLLDDMELLEGWTERVLTMQRNWIGRSEGATVTFMVEDTDVPIFTTRPDTLWGVTFFVLAPEHPLARRLVTGTPHEKEFDEFLKRVRLTSEIERTAVGRKREGVFIGAHAINPVNGERVPVWVADYVLMEYGTGAIMAVPAHDQRDFEFARQYDIPIRVVIAPPGETPGETLDADAMTEAFSHDGVMVNSGQFDGTPSPDSIETVIAWLEESGLGTRTVNFRLRDWLISRQRYWGAPIPIVHCPNDGEVAVPDLDLPVVLPDDVDFSPQGESPLAKHAFSNTTCPKCGGPARRESDTMDTFVDSSWYFLRYLSPDADDVPFDSEQAKQWMPVDQYTGGIEHAILHLLYSRFFVKVLYDMGLVPSPEPFSNLLNQGQVIMEGSAMSKSKGNLVAPAEIVDTYGADTARVTMLFAGPFEADVDWADVSPQGVFRWLSRVWRIALENASRITSVSGDASSDSLLRRATHRAIDGVTHDVERFRFNTAIAKLMTLANEISDLGPDARDADVAEAVTSLLKLLAPLAPFITEELWHRLSLGSGGSIHMEEWPVADPALVAEETVTCIVQINGKVRDRIEVSPGVSHDALQSAAMSLDRIRSLIDGKQVARVVVVPPKLVNIVVS